MCLAQCQILVWSTDRQMQPGVPTIDVHLFALAGGGRSGPQLVPPLTRLSRRSLYRAPRWSTSCAGQPMGDLPARRFCAPPGVSGSALVLVLAATLPALGKVLSAIDFKAMQLPCVVLCVFHYTKRRPAEHICIKLPMKQRLRKRCHFKNHLCVFIQPPMLTLWTHIQRTHTHTHASTEGRKRLREPSVGQMKWRNEKMHQKSDSNGSQ